MDIDPFDATLTLSLSMKFGYARVSTTDQHLTLQLDALQKTGCERIFQEHISGAKADRPELTKLLETLRSGDEVVVWKLDRLGRSLQHLIDLMTQFEQRGVALSSLNDHIDTATPAGKLVFRIFASLAEFERELIRERTMAGLTAARAQGRTGGKTKGLSEDAKKRARVAESLYKEKHPIKEIARQLNISRTTVYKYLDHRGVVI